MKKASYLRTLPLALLIVSLGAPAVTQAQASKIITLGNIAVGEQAATRSPATKSEPSPKLGQFCSKEKSGVRSCRWMPAMPDAVGHVKSILSVNGAVANVEASWLARGTKRTSLCFLNTNWKGEHETVCKPVPYAKPLDGYTIRTSVVDGRRFYKFTSKPGTVVGAKADVYARNFIIGVKQTAQQLQHVANHRMPISTNPGQAGTTMRATTQGAANLATGTMGESATSACGHDDRGAASVTPPQRPARRGPLA